MKNFRILLLITIMIKSSCFAQTNYRAGYIVTNSNDTVFGQIDYRTDEMNALKCKFKAQSDNSVTDYHPGDISGYRFIPDGKYYVSHEVTVDDITETVFLEYLVKGMVNLYYCNIKGQKYYFFEKDGELTQFSKKSDIIEDMRVVSDNKYKNMLRYYFKDYPSIMDNAGDMYFNQRSFVNLAKQYHDETCTTGEACLIYVNKKPDESLNSFRFSAYAGIQQNAYTVTKDYLLTKGFELETTSPVIGGKLNVYYPRWSRSLSLQLDISLSRLNYTKKAVYENTMVTVGYDFKTMIMAGKLGMEYKLLMKRFEPRLGAGFVYNHLFSEKGTYTYSDSDRLIEHQYRKKFAGYFVNVGLGYVLGNGHRVFIQGSIERFLKTDKMEYNGTDRFRSCNLVAGYTF